MDNPARVPASRRRWLVPAAAAAACLLATLPLLPALGRVARESLAVIPNCASPLVLDLRGKGLGTDAAETRFDIDGDGRPDRLRDLGHESGILVFDADKDGAPGESGRELLGNFADIDGDGRPDGLTDGFEALAALALEAAHRGLVEEGDLRAGLLGPEALRALEAGFGLRVRLGGLRGRDLLLKEAGVAGLRLSIEPSRARKNFDGSGSDLHERNGAVFLRADGTAAPYADVWLRHRSALATSGS